MAADGGVRGQDEDGKDEEGSCNGEECKSGTERGARRTGRVGWGRADGACLRHVHYLWEYGIVTLTSSGTALLWVGERMRGELSLPPVWLSMASHSPLQLHVKRKPYIWHLDACMHCLGVRSG